MPIRISKAETNRRLALYHQGMSDGAIGRIVGIQTGSVTYWRRKLGLPANFSTPIPRSALGVRRGLEDQELRRRLHAAGLSDKEIAARVGVATTSIASWRRRHQLKGEQNKWGHSTPQENAARMLLYQLGWSDSRIAAERKVHTTSIFDWRRTRELPTNFANKRPLHLQTDLGALVGRVKKAVGNTLAADIAEETTAELCLALLEGRLPLDAVEREARKFGNRTLERFASKYGPRSIDEEIGEDGFTLLDTMADESHSSWLEEMGATVW